MISVPVVVGTMYSTAHWLWLELMAAGVQVPAKDPPKTLAVRVTFPVGAVWVPPLVSVMVMTRMMDVPWTTDAADGDIAVLVLRFFIDNVALPELETCLLSPE